ncbi:MAG: hypothetical protein WDM89_00660 [Rhizomicrobium sp.]
MIPRDDGDHRVADEIDISGAIFFVLGRQCVRTKEGPRHSEVRDRTYLGRNTQHLQLAVGIETIARLDLDRGYAVPRHRLRTRQRLRDELAFGRGACRAHGGKYSAAGARDLFVGCALRTHLHSVARLPAKTRWVWQSTRPGVTHAPFSERVSRVSFFGRSFADPIHAMCPSAIAITAS